MSEPGQHKRIGELNGPWAFLFKLTQVSIPLLLATILPWSVWVTNSLYQRGERLAKIESWMSIGPRFTATDAENMRLRILQEVEVQNSGSANRIALRLDALTIAVQELKLELTKHTASTQPKP